MQRMMCISVEQYNRMAENYDSAVEEIDDLKGLLKTVLENTGKVVPVQQRWDIEHATGKDDIVKESLINAIVVFLKGMHVNAAWNIYYFILGMRQVRGRGTSKGRRGSDMKLKDITVKRIAPGELPSILCFQLNYEYHLSLIHI